MLTTLRTVLFFFLAVRTIGGLWMVWRNLRQAIRGLPYHPAPPWLELVHQGLKLLVVATVMFSALVWSAQQRNFAMLFIVVVMWLCLLAGFLERRMEAKGSRARS